MEHRWGTRIPVKVPVRISSASLAGSGTLRDLSVSGAYIETALALDSPAWVRIHVPRGAQTVMLLSGIVIRKDGGGIGIEWLDRFDGQLPLADASGLAWTESTSTGVAATSVISR